MSSSHEYYNLSNLIEYIDEPFQTRVKEILNENIGLFNETHGSTHNHQAWTGGYLDHVQEIMNIAVIFYGVMNDLRKLPFSVSDALLVLFLHDIEKPWKYKKDSNGNIVYKKGFETGELVNNFRENIVLSNGIHLSEYQREALKFVEGETNGRYSNTKRSMNELAAFCCMCDIASARIWFDRPKREDLGW